MRARLVLVLAALATGTSWGATPPTLLNYQGVLRNASGTPLSGTYDMSFAFYDDPTAGVQILVDTHSQFPLLASVVVTNGLFNVALGGGTVTDGTGPGTYTTLAQMFRDYGTVWMEIQVGVVNTPRDTLAPRIRIVSSAYALDTGQLGGQAAGSFVDTSASTQTKAGSLIVQSGLTGNSNSAFGVFGNGGTSGGAFQALSGISFAYAGYAGAGHYGLRAQGGDAGGFFRDADNLGTASIALTDTGMQGSGAIGGTFSDTGRTGYAELASGHNGAFASGNSGGGELDNLATGATGTLATQFGLVANGRYCAPFCGAGGHFANDPFTGRAYTALGETGLWASGSAMGGEFRSAYNTGHARLAAGNIGVIGEGQRQLESGGGGGYFQDSGFYATAIFGYGGYGVWANGNTAGEFLSDAYVGSETDAGEGADGFHAVVGDMNDVAGKLYRVEAGTGARSPDIGLAYYGGSPFTISGAGVKSFVQNDPTDAARQVVFAALEGDEAGTYTRGRGRIVNGEGRVKLDAAFAAVTNPDIGLTAIVSPRRADVPLAVASLSSEEIVVRAAGPEVDGVVFDFTVYGLRLGFENHETLQSKRGEAGLPPDRSGPPDPSSALARFAAMRGPTGDRSPLDLTRARRLEEMVRQAVADAPAGTGGGAADIAPAPRDTAAPPRPEPAPGGGASGADAAGAATPGAPGESAAVPLAAPLTTGEIAAVAAGTQAGGALLVPATGAPDEIVAGIVAGTDRNRVHGTDAPLALGGSIALCRADASFGPIKVGDLLTVSTTAGSARLAAGAGGGTVVGKALAPLAEGSDLIPVLVISR